MGSLWCSFTPRTAAVSWSNSSRSSHWPGIYFQKLNWILFLSSRKIFFQKLNRWGNNKSRHPLSTSFLNSFFSLSCLPPFLSYLPPPLPSKPKWSWVGNKKNIYPWSRSPPSRSYSGSQHSTYTSPLRRRARNLILTKHHNHYVYSTKCLIVQVENTKNVCTTCILFSCDSWYTEICCV